MDDHFLLDEDDDDNEQQHDDTEPTVIKINAYDLGH